LATGCSTVGKCGSGAGGCGPDGCNVAGGPAGGGYCGADGHEMDPCHPRMRPLKRHHGRHGAAGDYGPPTAGIAYPYYTTRGPRDFFEANPPSIGY